MNQENPKLSSILLKIIESSTIHGIPSIFRTKRHFMKLIWLVSFIVSVSICSIYIIRAFTEYFDYDTVTKFKIVNEVPTLFPTVTFCNINPFVSNDSNAIIMDILKNSKLTLRYLILSTLLLC